MVLRFELIKLLEENIGEKLNIDLSNDFFFFNLRPKVQATKAKISKWDYIKLKVSTEQRENFEKWKCNLGNGRKHLQAKHMLNS